MSILNKLMELSNKIKKENQDISEGANIHQNFSRALELEQEKRIKTKTDKGKTILLKPDYIIRILMGDTPLQIAGKGKVGKYEAVEALLRFDITEDNNH